MTMSDDSPPRGQRFSHVYISHPDLLPDSIRMRRRVGALLRRFGHEDLYALLNRELGTNFPSAYSRTETYWPTHLAKAELRDVLDAITLVAKMPRTMPTFLDEARRIFAEERVRYTIDELGGVHLAVDAEFEQSRVATIKRISGSRYASVREHVDAAYQALDGIPPDPKSAIRHMFFANEGLFRLMFKGAHQLGTSELNKHLKPAVDLVFDGEKPAIYVAQKQLTQFVAWIEGAHFYRHEPGSEEPTQPPLDLAIHQVSSGAAWLRWLAALDSKISA